MDKKQKRFVLIAFILIGLFFVPSLFFSPFDTIATPNGYDGLATSIQSVEHPDYTKGASLWPSSLYYKGYDPDFRIEGILGVDATGIKASISGNNLLTDETVKLPDLTVEQDNGDGTITNITLKQSIITWEFNVLVETYGIGSDAIKDISFIFYLANNQYSVFKGATEQRIAILKVTNMDVVYPSQQGRMDVEPRIAGADFELRNPTTNDKLVSVPDGIDIGYNLDNLLASDDATFHIDVSYAKPVISLGGARTEVSAPFRIQVDMLLIGEYVYTRPYEEIVLPEPEKTPWQMLGDWLGGVFSALGNYFQAPIMALIIIVGMGIAAVIIIRFTQRPKYNRYKR